MSSCERCYYLSISRESEEHVRERHFPEAWNIIHPWQSVFFGHAFTPQTLMHFVQSIPRSELRRLDRFPSNHSRVEYTYEFPFDVGFYPLQGSNCRTNRIKIVCAYVECTGCGMDVPTNIVTIYPWDPYYAQCGRY